MHILVMTVQDNKNVIVSKLVFDNTRKIKKIYNLQGIHLKCSALPWPPYLYLSDCETSGINCKSTG